MRIKKRAAIVITFSLFILSSVVFNGVHGAAFDGRINYIHVNGADTPEGDLVVTVELECVGNPISQSSVSIDVTCSCDSSWSLNKYDCKRNIRMSPDGTSGPQFVTLTWTIPASALPCQGDYTVCVYWDRSNNCTRGNLIYSSVCATDYSVPSLGTGLFAVFLAVLVVLSFWSVRQW